MKEAKSKQFEDLGKDEIITLLGHYLQILPSRWQGLQTYISIYLSLVTAILGVTIAGVTTFQKYPLNLLLEFGPLLILSVSEFAKHTIKKQNVHIKELISLIAKFEYSLGMHGKKTMNLKDSDNSPWPKDESLIPKKWLDARLDSEESDTFITEFQWSSAKFAYILFIMFQVFSAVMATLIIFLPKLVD